MEEFYNIFGEELKSVTGNPKVLKKIREICGGKKMDK